MVSEEKNTKVFIPGFVFAGLLKEAAESEHICDGFLIGEHSTKIVNRISDADHNGVELEKEIILHGTVQNSSTFSYYDNLGRVSDKQLNEKLFKTQADAMIGIYFIRRKTRSFLSLRERSIIKNLLCTNLFRHKTLLVFLFTPYSENNKSTHIFPYKCFICTKNGDAIPVNIDIINLSNLETREYSCRSRLLGSESNPRSQYLKLLQEEFRDRFFSKTGSVSLADNAYSLMYRTLFTMKELQEQIQASETSVQELEDRSKKSSQHPLF